MGSRSAAVLLAVGALMIAALVGALIGGEAARANEPAAIAQPRAAADQAESGEIARVLELMQRTSPPGLAALVVPNRPLQLLGQDVPLDRPDVREDLAYELVLTLGRPLMPMLWTRRSAETLPLIEEGIARSSLPADLKYLAMIESDLRWMVTSPAGAEGLWQIMPATAKRFGLAVDGYVDERRDPERSTNAAMKYLAELHAEFNDWFLVVAAYNAGEGRVREALADQGKRSYFDLYLPRETRRYVFRLLAAKLVFENPRAYGIEPMQPYWVPRYKSVEIQVKPARADLHDIAAQNDLDYASLRIANPQVRTSMLPRGTYRLRVLTNGYSSPTPGTSQ